MRNGVHLGPIIVTFHVFISSSRSPLYCTNYDLRTTTRRIRQEQKRRVYTAHMLAAHGPLEIGVKMPFLRLYIGTSRALYMLYLLYT